MHIYTFTIYIYIYISYADMNRTGRAKRAVLAVYRMAGLLKRLCCAGIAKLCCAGCRRPVHLRAPGQS